MSIESDPKIKALNASIKAFSASIKEDKALRNKEIGESLQYFSEAMSAAAKHMEACMGVFAIYLSTSIEVNLLIAEISVVCQTDQKTILDKALATAHSGTNSPVEVLRRWKRQALKGDQTFLK